MKKQLIIILVIILSVNFLLSLEVSSGWNNIKIDYINGLSTERVVVRPVEWNNCKIDSVYILIDSSNKDSTFNINFRQDNNTDNYLSFPISHKYFEIPVSTWVDQTQGLHIREFEGGKNLKIVFPFHPQKAISTKFNMRLEGEYLSTLRYTQDDVVVMDTRTNNYVEAYDVILKNSSYPAVGLRGLTLQIPKKAGEIEMNLENPSFSSFSDPFWFPFVSDKVNFNFYSSCDYQLDQIQIKTSESLKYKEYVIKQNLGSTSYIIPSEKINEQYISTTQRAEVKRGSVTSVYVSSTIPPLLKLILFIIPLVLVFAFYKRKKMMNLFEKYIAYEKIYEGIAIWSLFALPFIYAFTIPTLFGYKSQIFNLMDIEIIIVYISFGFYFRKRE